MQSQNKGKKRKCSYTYVIKFTFCPSGFILENRVLQPYAEQLIVKIIMTVLQTLNYYYIIK